MLMPFDGNKITWDKTCQCKMKTEMLSRMWQILMHENGICKINAPSTAKQLVNTLSHNGTTLQNDKTNVNLFSNKIRSPLITDL